MAIKITTRKTAEDLAGKSHWWGFADLPENVDYPCYTPADEDGYEDTLTFICQIRCEDIAQFDTEDRLPHSGMLYFFAELDYFLGDYEAEGESLGPWSMNAVRVIYSPDTDNLVTHEIYWDEETPACLPAESIEFSQCSDKESGHKLLGKPYFDDVEDEYNGMTSLLQIDEEDDWNLRFYDCGNLNILIDKEDLRNLALDKVQGHCHSL